MPNLAAELAPGCLVDGLSDGRGEGEGRGVIIGFAMQTQLLLGTQL